MKEIVVKKKNKDILNKRNKSQKVVFGFASAFLWIVASTYIIVYLWGLMAGLKTHSELVMQPFKLPEKWMFRNYLDAFTLLKVNNTNMLGMIGNSLWLLAGGSFLTILGTTLFAYVVTKYDFVGKKLLITINLVVIITPIIGALPSQMRVVTDLNLKNSPFFLITYFGCFGSNALYMMACFRNISWDYAEAALIDGASHYRVLFQIMLPQASGLITALLIMQAIGIWNDYMTPLLYLKDFPTLATGIFIFNTEMIYRARMDILFAALMLSSMPVLLLYILFHNTILKNVSLGGLKG